METHPYSLPTFGTGLEVGAAPATFSDYDTTSRRCASRSRY
ncbi:hypothetical protein [Leptolyngbya sp. PL-A2]